MIDKVKTWLYRRFMAFCLSCAISIKTGCCMIAIYIGVGVGLSRIPTPEEYAIGLAGFTLFRLFLHIERIRNPD